MLGCDSLRHIRLDDNPGFPPTRNKLGHHRAPSPVAQFSNLLEECRGIAAPLGLPPLEVVQKGMDLWSRPVRPFVLWKMTGTNPASNRLSLQIDRVTDRTD